MAGFPGVEGRAKASAQWVDGGLGEKGQGHVAVADVEVERAGAFPAERLVGVEEFFDVPAVGEVAGEGVDGVVVAGGPVLIRISHQP